MRGRALLRVLHDLTMGLLALLDLLLVLAVCMMVLAVILYVVGRAIEAHANRTIRQLEQGIEPEPYRYHGRP